MEKITSNQNNRVKVWKKLQAKKGRTKSGEYIIEGWHIVGEAIRHQKEILALMVTDEDFLDQLEFDDTKVPVYLITPEIANHISSTETPQGVFAVLKTEDYHESIPSDLIGAWLLLDNIQDPGNIGTMVRTADAAGVSGVVFGRGTADIYNPKVVRAMQGSQFHMQLFSGDLLDWLVALKKQQIPTYGTELNDQAVSYANVTPTQTFGLVMGNEGNGVSPEILSWTDQNLYIPMKGEAESLNVAVATGILLFHLFK
ncbi:RNA methyltransferase [Lentilactobacillus sp. TOM.63]|uniref:TrmH family RNA methyltransferase n=1 Tax=Lentilactobacillus sp. TOM.63 TaxID=3055077 RepID=UPI0025A04436|nr:RNA methyltransferase [Lentilactobacillus sp. TOM.63]MDM7517618.1 RNA methyltransferase [Lentilactobacillus sp. TOM.63]